MLAAGFTHDRFLDFFTFDTSSTGSTCNNSDETASGLFLFIPTEPADPALRELTDLLGIDPPKASIEELELLDDDADDELELVNDDVDDELATTFFR